ncbi:hypothetical protein J2810_002595 [Chryseobacterium rhizosphaerae]|uniref:hypothetical protein n=1 Tax=Chryseobacterium rhizosphaerae TaxID=395937 RepID=UPI0028628EF0|nr:hypothetical protein [Chryseobacterium rhizosphaerae]MDR6546536.1 hypothetical protein [Chryseobacterium rhizosphaerae]
MMKKKINIQFFKKTCIYIGLLLSQQYQSQVSLPNPDIGVGLTSAIASPEASNILRYQDFPDVGFIGGTDITIPIYEIKFDGMSIPISLSYNTKGAKVADIASNVGLGWTLNTGGSIALDVNDTYDFSANFKKFMGMWTNDRAGIYGNYTVPSNYGSSMADPNFLTDSAPDRYLINAPGLNDQFYLSRSNDNYYLKSLSNFKSTLSTDIKYPQSFDRYENFFQGGSAPPPIINPPANGSINLALKSFQIKNEKGFIYDFQKRLDSRNREPNPTYVLYTIDNIFPYSWLLSSIKSPNAIDKKIDFEYESFTNDYLHNSLNIFNNINTGSVNVYKYIYSDYNGAKTITNELLNYPEYRYKTSSNQRINSQRIKKIKFSEGIVEFNYGAQRLDYDGNILSRITIKDNQGNIIKYVEFNYSYFQSRESQCTDGYDCLRLKLDNIYDSTLKSIYNFTYGTSSNDILFPKRTSSKVDFLGYYNNNSSNLDFRCSENCNNIYSIKYFVGGPGYTLQNLPEPKIYFYPTLQKDNFLPFKLSNYTEEATTGNTDASANSQSLLGLLTMVKYPTKGKLKIEYENDDFEYLGNNYLLGSARIKSMEYVDNSDLSVRKVQFSYKNSSQLSSGEINFLTSPSHVLRGVINPGYKNSAIVGYSKVTIEEVGNGKTEKYYSNFSSFPDIKETINFPSSLQAENNFSKFFKFPSKYVQSMDLRRGQLQEDIVYDSQNNILKKNSYLYDYFIKDSFTTNKKIWKYIPNNTVTDGKELYNAQNLFIVYQNYLKKNSTEEHLNGQIFKTEKTYDYNKPYNLLRQQQIKISDNITEVTYQYPQDQNQFEMINANILSKPLIVENKTNGEVTGKKEIIYSKNASTNNLILPTSIQKFDIYNPSIPEVEITYDKYDSKGNIQQYTTKNGTSTTMIWGYNNTQPIAKIEGAKLSDIQQSFIDSIVNASNTDALATPNNDESTLLSVLDSFRNNSALSDYQITTYTYDSLIGVRSITPPSGIREMYIYDSAYRLEKIVDVNGKVLKEMKYNYKN